MKRIYALLMALSLGMTSPGPSGGSLREETSLRNIIDIVIESLDSLSQEEYQADEDTYEVVRVVDGDTIIIDIDGEETRLRLIGIDCPESVHPDKSKNTHFGKLASDFTRSKLEGKYVSLEYDKEKLDRYDRHLAYVYLDGVMFNETLLEEGLAKAKAYPPNTKYKEEFEEIEKKAKEEDRGMWAIENLDKNSKSYKIFKIFEKVLEIFSLVKDVLAK